MIDRKAATVQAIESGYSDVRDWADDRDLSTCATCKRFGKHDEMRLHPSDMKDNSYYCESCYESMPK